MVKSIPISLTADEMKSIVTSMINVQHIEVMKAPSRETNFGVASVIKFKTSDPIKMLAVIDKFTIGKNACV